MPTRETFYLTVSIRLKHERYESTFSYGVLRSFTGSVSWAPLTDSQSSLGHYFLGLFWGGRGDLSVGFTLLVFVLGLSAVTGSCVTEITHCGKRVTIFATY